MTVTTVSDPSLDDGRPLVAAADAGNRPLWIGIGAILILGVILFSFLNARRQTAMAPAVKARASDLNNAPSQVPPPLFVPPEPRGEVPLAVPAPTMMPAPPLQRPVPAAPQTVAPMMMPMRDPTPPVAPPQMVPTRPGGDSAGPIIFDQTVADPVAAAPATGASGGSGTTAVATRARAARVQNRATIVPQGTLIAAVLETALDSTQPGQVRALVSNDVPNLHGSKILIPRGSRLFGEYRGELQSGQNRALVQWTRLVRPDGVTIAIDSPAADRLGRAGIKGKVNSHFFERFGGALLQSAISVGTVIGTQSLFDSPVLVAIPSATQGATTSLVGQPPKPTLTVRQGTRIAVFVVRDLDFTAVEGQR